MASESIRGRATLEGTSRFAARHTENLSEHYRTVGGLCFSDLGIGTFLGRCDDETDGRYTETVVRAVERGVNVVDSAINYRFQRSERSVGAALTQLLADKKISRDEIIVTTKGGFIPYDREPPKNPTDWLDKNLFEPGIIAPGDIVSDCHCIEPEYIRNQVQISLTNLGLETIDIYCLHNVETQLAEISKNELEEKLRAAFETLEDEVEKGHIARYGLATWGGFRVPPEEFQHHSLVAMLDIARSVAGEKHHFKVVQLPFNFIFREAATQANQVWRGDRVTFLRLAPELGLIVMASVPLLQGKLPSAQNDAHRAISFSAAAPGITTALVGMSRVAHVDQNTEYLRRRRMDPVAWRKVLDVII